MANLTLACLVSGSTFDPDDAELQRVNTEVSKKAGIPTSLGDYADYDCSTLTGWTANTTGTADAPSQVTFDDKSCIKLSVPTKTTGGDTSNIYRAHSSISAGAVLSVKFYMTGFDTGLSSISPTTNMCAFYIAQETVAAQYGALVYLSPDGIWNSTGTYKIYNTAISQDAWHELIIVANIINGHDIYLDGVKIVSCADLTSSGIGAKYTYLRMFTFGEYAGTIYLDEIKVGTAVSIPYPETVEVIFPQIDSGVNTTVWDMSTIAIAINPNGESGSANFQYSIENTGTPTYNGTWLSLSEWQTETDGTGRYFQPKVQLAGTISQDATVTDLTITANITTDGSGGEGGEFSYGYMC